MRIKYLKSPNYIAFKNRRNIQSIVIHYTGMRSLQSAVERLLSKKYEVSSHYVIGRTGKVLQLVKDNNIAWHAGISNWGNNIDINSSSIGIELDNNGKEPFDSAQINSLLTLLEKLKSTYEIPVANFIGHGDIAPKRKVDPNINFPWQFLAKKGYGVWFNPDATIQLPSGLSIPLALNLVGYDIKDTTAAKLAFKRHFRQDSTAIMNEQDKSVLAQLILNKVQK